MHRGKQLFKLDLSVLQETTLQNDQICEILSLHEFSLIVKKTKQLIFFNSLGKGRIHNGVLQIPAMFTSHTRRPH